MRTSRRKFLKTIPVAAGALASTSGVVSLFSSSAQAQMRPLNMISLGDSIVWGQGLPESMKFRNIVASWIESQFHGTRKVNQICRAHSGARTGWGAYPAETNGADPDEFYKGMSGYPYPGEVPFGYPSVSSQIGKAVQDLQAKTIDPSNVDLVLFDGGANDISIINVLDVAKVDFPANGPNWVRRNTNAMVVGHMANLLPQVTSQFPNAVLIVTGYYPPVSEKTDLLLLTAYLAILGLLPGVTTNLVGATTGTAPDVLLNLDMILKGTVLVAPALRAALTLRSKAFAEVAFNGFSDLVNGANQGVSKPRVGLAWPYFSDDNCYGAPDSYLFAAGNYLSDEMRGRKWQAPPGDWSTKPGIAYYRAEECSSSFASDPFCYEASIGHPNEHGARAYADAIIQQIRSNFSDQLGIPKPPPPPTMKLNIQFGSEGVGVQQMKWVVVTAADAKTGKPVNGTVSIATYSESASETSYTDSSGKVHRSRQQISTANRVCAPPNVACNSGPTGTKVYYRCGRGGNCILSVDAAGYTGAEVTLP